MKNKHKIVLKNSSKNLSKSEIDTIFGLCAHCGFCFEETIDVIGIISLIKEGVTLKEFNKLIKK